MWKLVPSTGEVKIENNPELEMAIEKVRQMNRLYYDFYNNGCCNVVGIERVQCYECGGTEMRKIVMMMMMKCGIVLIVMESVI